MSESNDRSDEQQSVMDIIEDGEFDWTGWFSGRSSRLYDYKQVQEEPEPQSVVGHPIPGQGMLNNSSVSNTSFPAETDHDTKLLADRSVSTYNTVQSFEEGGDASMDSFFYSTSEHSWLMKEEDEDILDHAIDDDDDDDDGDDGKDGTVNPGNNGEIVNHSLCTMEDIVAIIDNSTYDDCSEYDDQVSIPLQVSVSPQNNSHLYDRTADQILKSETYQLFDIESWEKITDNALNGFKVTVLIGFSNVFKKMHYQKFLKEFRGKFASHINDDINLLLLNSVGDLDFCLKDSSCYKVVVLENAFGDNVFNEQDFSQLCKITKNLKHVDKLLALMLTSTSHCFIPGKNRFRDSIPDGGHFEELIVNLDHPENISTIRNEKREALRSALDSISRDNTRTKVHLSETEIDVICNAENPVFFDCCDLVKNYKGYSSEIWGVFREPMPILVPYFLRFREASGKDFSVLALCALKDEINWTSYCKEQESEISKYFHCVCSKQEFRDICIMFSDTFLQVSKDEHPEIPEEKINFRLQMYQNAVLCVLFNDLQKYVIKNCPISFLTNVLPLIQHGLCEQVIFNKFDELAKRFIQEIHHRKCSCLLPNKIWEDEKFMEHFDQLNQNEKVLYTTITAEDNGVGFLAWSSWSGSVDLVHWILKKMKQKKIKSKYIEDAVMLSCASGNLKVLEILWKMVWKKRNTFHDICKRSESHFMCMENNYRQKNYPATNYTRLQVYSTPWHTAIAYGHLDIMKFMLSKESAIVNSRDSFKCGGLHIACRLQKEEVVRFLLDKSADVNLVDNIGNTPLHEACASGNVEITKMILTHRPKMVANVRNQDAMHKAVASKSVEVLCFLFEKTEVHQDGDVTFLMYTESSQYSLSAYYQQLLQIEDGVLDGETLLHKACLIEDNLEVIKYLIIRFPELVNRPCSMGATALHTACKNLEGTSTTEFLLKNGAEINSRTDELNTPLHLACEKNHLKQVQFLIDTKKAKYLKNRFDKFPHELTENKEIVKLISNQDNMFA